MSPPRYTIIIPAAQFAEARPALARLREVPSTAETQILVALGRHPARQRNAALERAAGEFIVFLDNDCVIGPTYWAELERDFTEKDVEVVGGPALLRAEATGLERIFHALLTHPLVVGPICARYSARGAFRPSSQSELILCNLAVRRGVFTRIGLLPVELYPNEENEWLDRAQAAGVGVYYDPALQVYRPQRDTCAAMAQTLVRYGIGRTSQLRVSGWHFTRHQLAPLVLLLPLAAVLHGSHGLAIFAAGWMLIAVIVAATCDSGLSLGQRVVAGLLAPCIPLLYATGQVLGWFQRAPRATPKISVVDERGATLNAVSP